jgi:fructose-1,6-bisphosphatase II
VRYGPNRAITESLVMRARSGTIRQVRSTHHLDRLGRYSTVDYRHAAESSPGRSGRSVSSRSAGQPVGG